MTMPLVSIITVVRNDREGFLKTLESVIAQDYPAIEYIVVDGASTDGTREAILEQAAWLTKWVSEPDQGLYDAMNKGLRMASGEWVQFLNAGDWFTGPGVVSLAMKHGSHDIDAVFGDAFHVLEGRHLFVPAGSPNNLRIGPFCSHQSLFMRPEVLQRAGGFKQSEWPASDYGLLVRAHQNGCRWAHAAEPMVYFPLGGISETLGHRGHVMLWRISRENFGPSWRRDLLCAYRLFRVLVKWLLRKLGLGRVVVWYQKRKAWFRDLSRGPRSGREKTCD